MGETRFSSRYAERNSAGGTVPFTIRIFKCWPKRSASTLTSSRNRTSWARRLRQALSTDRPALVEVRTRGDVPMPRTGYWDTRTFSRRKTRRPRGAEQERGH